jgi:hypothetical protein
MFVCQGPDTVTHGRVVSRYGRPSLDGVKSWPPTAALVGRPPVVETSGAGALAPGAYHREHIPYEAPCGV